MALARREARRRAAGSTHIAACFPGAAIGEARFRPNHASAATPAHSQELLMINRGAPLGMHRCQKSLPTIQRQKNLGYAVVALNDDDPIQGISLGSVQR